LVWTISVDLNSQKRQYAASKARNLRFSRMRS
jgi:hypothetical protein